SDPKARTGKLDEHEKHAFVTYEQQDTARWQDHAIDEAANEAAHQHGDVSPSSKEALRLRNDPEFRRWFGRWKSMPDRLVIHDDGSYEINLPSGVPAKMASELKTVIPQTNIVLTSRAMVVRDRIVNALPNAELDPHAPTWKTTRAKLVELFGD